MDGLIKDFRFALRTLLRNPGFTAVAVLTLALAIGMNTALFSVVHTVILSSLPFHEADRLVVLQASSLDKEGVARNVSYPNLVDWREQSESLEDIAAVSFGSFTLTGGTEPERVFGEYVTANYFSILKVSAQMGRTIHAGEDRLPQGDYVAVLSHDLWQRKYGGDPDILMQTININGQVHTIVGIMPMGFEGVGGYAEVWTPLSTVSSPRDAYLQMRGARWLYALGRLESGVSLTQAQAEMTGIADRLREVHSRLNRNRGVTVIPLSRDLVGSLSQPVWTLFAAVGIVLLIACFNVANLLLARASTRQRDIAIRAALGAGRGRILRELLVEGLLLSFVGGLLGLLIALWGVDAAQAALADAMPTYMVFELDGAVMMFAAGLCLVVTLMASLLPAWRLSRQDPQQFLRDGGRTPSAAAGGQAIRKTLVVAELAMSLVLLAGAGLMLRTLHAVMNQNMGFDSSGALTARVNLPGATYPSKAEITRLARQVEERLGAHPAVLAASASSDYPLAGNDSGAFVNYEGQDVDDPDQAIRVWYHSGTEDFFRVMGIRLLEGRTFTSLESADSIPVTVLSQAAAERFFPGQNPIGKRMRFRRSDLDLPWLEVVGVVDDVRYRTRTDSPDNDDPDVYMPLSQAMTPRREIYFSIRTAGDPSALANDVRAIVKDADSNLPVFSVNTLSDNISSVAGRQRFTAYLLGGFALLALFLAAIGTFGVISYSVSSRMHEIGIRIALGAQRKDILRLVVGQGLFLVSAGLAAGLAIALSLSHLISSLLYRITPTDPLTFVQVAIILAAVALVASYVPARRATRVDPMVALRYE